MTNIKGRRGGGGGVGGCLGDLRGRGRSGGASGGRVYECVVVGTPQGQARECFFLAERTLREFWREAA